MRLPLPAYEPIPNGIPTSFHCPGGQTVNGGQHLLTSSPLPDGHENVFSRANVADSRSIKQSPKYSVARAPPLTTSHSPPSPSVPKHDTF